MAKRKKTTPKNQGKDGRFLPGNQAAVGRSAAADRADKFRKALADAINAEQLAELLEHMLKLGLSSEDPREAATAFKAICERLIGPPVALDLLARLEELEQQIQTLQSQQHDAPPAT